MSYSTFLLDLDHTLFDTEASEVMAFEQTMLAARARRDAPAIGCYAALRAFGHEI